MVPHLVALLSATFLVTVAMIQPLSAKPERTATRFEYEPESYSNTGKTTGCGVSFRAAWTGEPDEVLGATGSFNFFFIPDHKNVMAVIKLSGVVMIQQVPITFAWISANGYGKTTDFTPAQVSISEPSWRSSILIRSRSYCQT